MQRGFTLIEMLVVAAIIGLLTTTVALTLSSNSRQAAASDARRLATLLETAIAEAQAGRRQIAWSAREGGYDFFAAEPSVDRTSHTPHTPRWTPLGDDETFHARQLDNGVRIARVEVDGQPLPAGGLLVLRRGDPPLFRITLEPGSNSSIRAIELRGLPTGQVQVRDEGSEE